MLQLEVGGQRYVIAAGEMVVGSAPECALSLSGEGVYPRHAVVRGLGNGGAAIRRFLPEAEVLVNRIRLGDDPTPLLHGDKIRIGPHELVVVDAAAGGGTQLISNADAIGAAGPPRDASLPVYGGRLVCLTDGREYAVESRPICIGRDAACEVVVSGSDVSRRHVEVRPTAQGCMVVDASSNGTFVNGERVEGERLLVRSDVIRVGPDEFRFYPDAVPEADALPRGVPPPGAAESLKDTLFGLAVTPRAAGGPPLASLLVRSGEQKGVRLSIRGAAVTIGRADSNDIVLADTSVSAAHAKLLRRGIVWLLSDLGSTNGTFVDEERVAEEMALSPGATIRFGDVAALFEPLDDAVPAEAEGSTRVMEKFADSAAVEPAAAEPSVAPRRGPRPPRPSPRRGAETSSERKGIPRWVMWASICALAAAAALTMLR